MTLVTINSDADIDKQIKHIQSDLYDYLLSVGWTDYDSYPKAYKNQTPQGVIPEIYTDKGEYSEIFLNDRVNATSFFIVDDSRQISDRMFQANIKLIFQVDISALYPRVTHRADEEVHEDVYYALQNNPFIVNISNLNTSLTDIYSGLRVDLSIYDDMQPYHIFSYDIEIRYSNICRKRNETNFLLLENNSFLLQENGSRIKLEV